MKLNTFLLWLSLFSIVLAVRTELVPRELHSRDKGSTCVEVYSNGKNASILVELTGLGLTRNMSSGDILSLPVAIFRYSHIAYYDFPTYDEFNDMYKFGEGDIMYNKLLHLNISEINNSYLVKTLGYSTMHVDNFIENGIIIKLAIKMEIEQSGIYCVYIGTPLDTAIYGRMSARVSYQNSYGLLPYSLFVHYQYLIFFSILGGIFFIVIFYYYMFKKPKILGGIGDFSSIYKAILFYCLIPLITRHSLLILFYYVRNDVNYFQKFGQALYYWVIFVETFRILLLILIFDYLPLILIVDYGIFYISPESKFKIPVRYWKITVSIIFFFNILSFTVTNYYMAKYQDKLYIIRFEVHTVLNYLIQTHLFLKTNGFYRYLWKTIHILGLAQVTITSCSTLEDPTVFKRISRSLQLSFLVSNLTNYIIQYALIFIRLMQFVYQFKIDNCDKKMAILGYANRAEIYNTLFQEFETFKMLSYDRLPDDLGSYILLFLIFIIWYRTSKVITSKRIIKEIKKE